MLSVQSLQAALALPALRGLEVADREALARHFDEVSLPRGETVFRQGDAGDAVYVVLSGAVRVRADGRVLVTLGPGQWFGEMALLTGAPRSATVEVALDAQLLALRTEAFQRLLELQPELYRDFAEILSRRLAVVSRERSAPLCEIVLVVDPALHPERRALVLALAGALERELDAPVALVTLTAEEGPAGVPRRDRRDVLIRSPRDRLELRVRLSAALAPLAQAVPLILIDVADPLQELSPEVQPLADTLVVCSAAPRELVRARDEQRVIALCERDGGPLPPLVSCDRVVLPADPGRRRAALGRLARLITRRSVGVALGSGAAYGLAHIGVLQELDAAGIPVDFIAGASVGAIVGAHYALGVSPAEMSGFARMLGDRKAMLRLLPRLAYIALDLNLLRPGMFSGERFMRSLEALGYIGSRGFGDLDIPFRAVATDVETGARVELADGDLSVALRASFSAPWVLSPVRLDGRVLIDGGMGDPVPCDTVRSMGADLVIAVNVVPLPDPGARNPLELALGSLDRANPINYFTRARRLPNSFDVVARTLQIMQHELGNVRAAEADVAIRPDLSRFWLLDFWNAAGLIDAGAEATRGAVPVVRERLDRLRREGPM